MKLYLIRHGETPWNKMKKIQGQVNIPLNDYGRYLADETAKGLKDVPFTMCFTSPLNRACETAERVLAGRNIPLIKDERIIEMGFGLGEAELMFDEDGTQTEYMHNFFHDTEKYIPKDGGESFQDVLKRTDEFMSEIINNEKYKDEIILISSHGCAISAILCNVRGNAIADIWGDGVPKNCAVTEISVVDGKPVILSENVIYYDPSKKV